jgi:hypothetical protein
VVMRKLTEEELFLALGARIPLTEEELFRASGLSTELIPAKPPSDYFNSPKEGISGGMGVNKLVLRECALGRESPPYKSGGRKTRPPNQSPRQRASASADLT